MCECVGMCALANTKARLVACECPPPDRPNRPSRSRNSSLRICPGDNIIVVCAFGSMPLATRGIRSAPAAVGSSGPAPGPPLPPRPSTAPFVEVCGQPESSVRLQLTQKPHPFTRLANAIQLSAPANQSQTSVAYNVDRLGCVCDR